ncbi:MAG: putative dual-specificity RNA methyltransferase RlmN [Candidatus Moranbacteria bacterium GW2011_GWE2_35_2-]|nr:MAG: putative dual-specificity RNA methyltransferase RlmN [Candidatus Moranbacteria bacterium GW2011_GWE2_35_2-]KKQ04511.1 MAG: putative dual-specificity RNA methyltransferase RlmN [Candidatus Moranbacteria bacterium GW2011_GWF1_36_4]KKQ22778.1 MAG: putative dual-specificity RNA methyltransferase RlmN [Candidatus Moranbacteria bacterium GW2011_GWF2_37_11]KKQ28789.1 MAG: putative dual-specificity RNA methyltransferase RlmN [Candidatus Moranbacteria bacterium GW2011_GWD1_37_17]KKQ30991.1 MAG: 
MKVINRKKYSYPRQKTDKWKKETFQPLSDLKLRLKLDDGNMIESAAFHMIMDGRMEEHACISTQVGCKYGCKFCTSGKNGYLRNLSKKEMKDELRVLAKEEKTEKFDCIVFMGIGEPLDNYDEVVNCMRELIEKKDLYSGIRRIALATVGIPDSLNKLAEEKLPIDLWVSLHASDDEKRKKIMPAANKYSISEIIKSAEDYYKKTGRFIWLNYMLFLGFNNLNEDVKKLANLLKDKKEIFKLILTEPNNDIDNYQKAGYGDLLEFEDKLRNNGVENEIVRFMTAGKDVGAGCGEFVFIPKK